MLKKTLIVLCAVIMTAFFLSGCNEYERRGISPLPQNRPASWETQPFGNAGFRN